MEPAGWWYLTACGSYSTGCLLNFPIQSDVTVKQKTVAKTFFAKQLRAHVVRTPSVGHLTPFIESFWNS